MAAPSKLQSHFAHALSLSERLVADAKGSDAELDLRVPGVSGWTVAQHLDHLGVVNSLIVESRIAEALNEPEKHASAPLSFRGRMVLWLGWIPRGKVKAPEFVSPTSTSLTAVRENVHRSHALVSALKERLDAIEACRGRSLHPILGAFSSAQWIRFMAVHTWHHVKIIDCIQRAK